MAANDFAHAPCRNGDAVGGIDRLEQQMPGHGPRQIGQQLERQEVGTFQHIERRRHRRQFFVAVDRGAAVSRDVLDHRHHAFRQQPFGRRTAQCRHRLRPVGIGTVADYGVGLGKSDVEDRQAVDIAADRGDVRGQQPRIQPGRFESKVGIARIEIAQQAGRRGLAPVRQPEAGNAAAFLVDQHRRIGPGDAGTQIVDQPARALRRIDVSGKQDEAQRIGVAEESAFVGREVGPSAAQDRRARAAHE